MEHTKGELEVISSSKAKFKDAYFIRLKDTRDSFIAKTYGHTGLPAKVNAEHLVKCWNCHDQLLEACEGGITTPILREYLDWAKHMENAPNLAVYRKQFGALCALLNDLITHQESAEAAIPAADQEQSKEKKQ